MNVLAALVLLLQDKTYQPVGAPADPKVPAHWNRYHDTAEIADFLHRLAGAFPKLCKLESLGKSHGGRDMWVLTITNSAKGRESEKAGFWIDGGIHANELQGPEVVLYTAWFLLETYGRNETVTRLLDERVFYLLPTLSPDSRDAHMKEAATTHSPRSGQRPVDDDRDGLVDEDGPDDLDGDKNIVQMRVRDSNGKWKAHPDYPALLIPVGPEEKGEYTILGEEGIDNDGDGRVNEDGPGFYDPNRDWAWNWQPKHIQWGAHLYPFSIAENRMVADFVMARANLAGAQSYHNAGGWILRGPGGRADRYAASDIAVYDVLGKKGEMMLPAYRYSDVVTGLYEVFGGELDWFYTMRGAFTFTNELFTPFNLFRKEGGGWFGKDVDLHLFNKYLLFEDGFVKWHPVDHPQYGKIEVGGYKKTWMRQPPSFLLEEECHRNMAFTLYHADQMPQARVESIETRAIQGGLVEVTATIVNPKVIPTRAEMDVRNKISPPDVVSIEAKNLKVIAGLWDSSRWFREGREQPKKPEAIRLDTIPGMGAMYVRWIVKGDGPYTVTVRSAKGGVHSLTK